MFEKGVKGLQKLFPSNSSYYCPICFRGFKDSNSPELTIEHVPAERLGGKPLLLTCRKCNNQAGHKIQSHQIERQRQEEFWAGKYNGDMNLELSTQFGILRGNLKSEPDEIAKFNVQPKRNNPKAMHFNEEQLKESKLHKLGKSFDWHSSRVADLRDSYLFLFCTYGYSFIIWNFYDWVRIAIQEGKGPDSNKKWSIYLNDPFTKDIQEKHFSPVILRTTNPLNAIVIANGQSGCIMPTVHCSNPYKYLSDEKANLEFSRTINPVSSNMEMLWDFSQKRLFNKYPDKT